MRIAPLADVKARLSAYLDECGVEGPVGHYAQWRLMLGHSPRFQALLDRSRQSIKEGKGLAEEALWGGRSQTSASTKGRRSERPPNQPLKLTEGFLPESVPDTRRPGYDGLKEYSS